MIEAGFQLELIRKFRRIGRQEREVRVLRAAIADDRVRTTRGELTGGVVQSSAKIRRAGGDTAVLVAGRKIGKERQGQPRSGGWSEAELRGQMDRADAAVGEFALIVVAVYEAVAIAAIPSPPWPVILSNGRAALTSQLSVTP